MEPVFLFCVGATKAGTSWLYGQLRRNPECHLRAIKEYHYFDSKDPAQMDKRMVKIEAEIATYSARGAGDLNPLQVERLADLRSWAKAAGRIDIDLYRQYHFDAVQGRTLVRDLTPAYSILSHDTLQGLNAVARNLRIVYLIRDPFARLWSHVRMRADKTAPDAFEQTAHSLLRRILSGQSDDGVQRIVQRGDYKTNLPKLRRRFDPAKLLVMFTKELMTDRGFARLLAFLGLSPVQGQFDKAVHLGRAMNFPAQLRSAALQVLRPQYDYIASEFSDLPQAWRRNMNEALT